MTAVDQSQITWSQIKDRGFLRSLFSKMGMEEDVFGIHCREEWLGLFDMGVECRRE